MPTVYKSNPAVKCTTAVSNSSSKTNPTTISNQVLLLTQTKHDIHYNTICYILHTVLARCCKTATKGRRIRKSPHAASLTYRASMYTLCTKLYMFKFYPTRGHKIARGNLAHPLACPHQITATGNTQEVAKSIIQVSSTHCSLSVSERC